MRCGVQKNDDTMPIDYKRYPTNWLDFIRPTILARDGHRCKHCGIDNYALLLADWTPAPAWLVQEVEGVCEGFPKSGHAAIRRSYQVRRVVLTVAHLDQDINNNRLDNLAALCQRCHLNHDRPHNAAKRRYGRQYTGNTQYKIKFDERAQPDSY